MVIISQTLILILIFLDIHTYIHTYVSYLWIIKRSNNEIFYFGSSVPYFVRRKHWSSPEIKISYYLIWNRYNIWFINYRYSKEIKFLFIFLLLVFYCAKHHRNEYLNIKDSAFLRNHLYAFDNEKWISTAKRDSLSVMVIYIYF